MVGKTTKAKKTITMKPADVLIRPIITEKVNRQMENKRCYTFEVAYAANKLEIKKAIEEFYGVQVATVNTGVVPSKTKSRFTKAGFLTGRKPSYKKAMVTLAPENTIELFS